MTMSAPIVITDAEERAVLGACRGLASAGYRVSAVARYRPVATHWSRSCAERVLLPDPRSPAVDDPGTPDSVGTPALQTPAASEHAAVVRTGSGR